MRYGSVPIFCYEGKSIHAGYSPHSPHPPCNYSKFELNFCPWLPKTRLKTTQIVVSVWRWLAVFEICIGISEQRPQHTFLWKISDETFTAIFFHQDEEVVVVAGFTIPKGFFFFLKLVWIHSFQVNETTFPFTEQCRWRNKWVHNQIHQSPFSKAYFRRSCVVCENNLRSRLLIKVI